MLWTTLAMSCGISRLHLVSRRMGCTCIAGGSAQRRCYAVRSAVRAAAHQPADDRSSAPRLPALHRVRRLPGSAASPPPLQPPPVDVDQELWEVLDLCSVEELEELHDILFGGQRWLTAVAARCGTPIGLAAGTHHNLRRICISAVHQRMQAAAR